MNHESGGERKGPHELVHKDFLQAMKDRIQKLELDLKKLETHIDVVKACDVVSMILALEAADELYDCSYNGKPLLDALQKYREARGNK